jgi:hypothetical protein
VRSAFSYSVVRLVPQVEREEFVNAGIILFCDPANHLAARIELDVGRLLAIAPSADVGLARRHLDAIPRICAGGADAGPIGLLPARERWRWLVAPRSTMVQMSPPHAGLCDDLAAEMERLLAKVVRS